MFHLYKREGEPGRPHDHSATVGEFRIGADSTDGLDVTSASLGPEWPGGMLVAMNSASRNFLFVRWSSIASAILPPQSARSGRTGHSGPLVAFRTLRVRSVRR